MATNESFRATKHLVTDEDGLTHPVYVDQPPHVMRSLYGKRAGGGAKRRNRMARRAGFQDYKTMLRFFEALNPNSYVQN